MNDGRYKAKYIPGSMQMGMSRGGHEQVAVDLQTTQGVVTCFLMFSAAAKPYSESKLIALGWGGPGTPLDDASLDKEVDVDVSHEVYEGQSKMRVDIVGSGGRAKMKTEMDPAQKASFLQRLTGVAPGAAKPKDPVPF